MTENETNDKRDTGNHAYQPERVGLGGEQGILRLDLVDVVEGLDFERGEGHESD